MNTFWLSVGALIPPIGVGVIFWLVMRWIVRADRQERAAIARIDAASANPSTSKNPADSNE